jgi:hypothetical protein
MDSIKRTLGAALSEPFGVCFVFIVFMRLAIPLSRSQYQRRYRDSEAANPIRRPRPDRPL